MAFEQNDEEEWLRQQASAGRASLATPEAQPQAAPWARAREMMDRQAGMQYTAPERFSKPVEAEAAPKNEEWKGYLAMLLNLVGDKGRGIGDIYGRQVDTRNKQLADWRKSNSPQALADREMQMAQLRNADRQGFEADRRVLGDQIGQEMQVAGAEQGAARDERNFDNQQQQFSDTYTANATNHADNVRLQEAGQRQQAELARVQMAASAGQAAASRAQSEQHFKAAQAQHLLDQEEALNARRDAYAHADRAQEAGFAHADDTQTRALQTQRDIHDLTHPAPVAPEGYRVKQGLDAQFRQSMNNKAIEAEMLKQSGTAAQIQNTLKTLVDLRNAPSSASNKKLYDAAMKSLIGDRSKEGSTGVLSGTEFERYLADLPEYGAIDNVSTMRGAWDVMSGRNPALETLQGVAENFKKTNAAKMTASYGLEYADTPAASTPAPKPADEDPYIKTYGAGLRAY